MDRQLSLLADIATATALLTRLPIRARFGRTAAAAWAWPVVGIAIAAIAGGVAWTGLAVGVPATLVAGLVMATQIVVTGALHEDGLADCADGFWGGFNRDRRLEIMRDSHLGAYGAIALIVALGLRWAALSVLLTLPFPLFWAVFTIAAVVSRGAMLAVAGALPHARDDGLSVRTGRPMRRAAIIGIALSAAIAVTVSVGLLIVAALAAIGCALLARAKIGGQTGDVLGATQQVTEIVIIVAATTIII